MRVLKIAGLPFQIIISIFSIFILITATVLSLYRFIQVKYKQFLYIALNWLGIAVWLILIVIQLLILLAGADFDLDLLTNIPFFSDFLDFFRLNIELFSEPITFAHLIGLIGMFSIIPTIGFTILLVDFNRASVDPIKSGILGVVSVTFTITALSPGQGAYSITPYTYFAQILLQVFWSLLWIIYAIRLYIHSPKSLQGYAFVVLVGSILAGAVPTFNTATGLIPAGLGISELSFALGLLLMASAFILQPQLLFILPYKTSRLGVFNDKGTPLFSHQWISGDDDSESKTFFTEIRENVSSILSEAIKNPEIREIHLDKSILIINRYRNFSFVLLTVKASRSLLTALNTFSVKFVSTFEELLAKSVYIDPKDHETASTLVAECFPFLAS